MTRKYTRVHKGFQQGVREVRSRHPDPMKHRDGEDVVTPQSFPGYGGGGDCGCDNKDTHADSATYVLDGFDLPISAPIIPAPDGGVFGFTDALEADDTTLYDASHNPVPQGFTLTQKSGALADYVRVQQEAGVTDYGNTNRPPGSPCGLIPTWLGYRDREAWWRVTLPTLPANVAGFYMQVALLNDGGQASQGGRGKVLLAAPTALGQGADIGAFQFGTSTIDYRTLFVPSSLFGAAGSEVWVGVAAAWVRDDYGKPSTGPWYCNFDNPADTGQGNSGWARSVPRLEPARFSWAAFDSSGAFGSGADGEAQGAWFVGNLPWVVTPDAGGVLEFEGGVARWTPPAGGGQAVLTMAGADSAELGEDYDLDVGEPWSNELGVRMMLVFRVSSVIDASVAGVRGLSMQWNDGSGDVVGRVHFGDPTDAVGMSVIADGASAFVGGEDMVPDEWYWMWLDTRNPLSVVGRAWLEVDAQFPGSGESQRKVRVARDPLDESGVAGDAFVMTLDAGDGQVIEVSAVYVVGPADDGEVVHEHIGNGDGVRVQYWTSQPYLRRSLQFDVAGIVVRAIDTDTEDGRFESIDFLPVPDAGRMDVTYIVDRTIDDGTEEAWSDDSADDP